MLRELRDPFLHALGLREAHDREDDVDETLEADDAVQAERRRAALLTAGGRAPQGAARRPWARLSTRHASGQSTVH